VSGALFDSSRKISVFGLVMINVVAVDSLRTLPFAAKFGTPLIFYYILLGLIFFIPVGLVTAELATAWPKTGGIYVWVRQAFGPRVGLLVVWLQWIYNVVWYPTILSAIVIIGSYAISPSYQVSPQITVSIVLALFWLATLSNMFGIKLSSVFSSVGTILGTMLPMFAIICLGIWWLMVEPEKIGIGLTFNDIFPKFSNLDSVRELSLITQIIFGLMGLEMSAVHAGEVKNPSKDYPKALLISSFIILITLTFASLSVAIVVPQNLMSVISGTAQSFNIFLAKLNLLWLLPVVICAIIIGGLGGIATWIIGPTKGLFAAAVEDNLPKFLSKTNKYKVPVNILLMQAIIVSVLSSAFLLLPSIENAYETLSQLTAILALLMYVLMFVAAIYLRYKYPDHPRPFKIPGGKFGLWLVCLTGGLTSLAAMLFAFVPPMSVPDGSLVMYSVTLLIGVIVFCAPVLFLKSNNTL
jgi:amino acid transporter